MWIYPVILAFAGGLVNLVFWRLYQTQQELEHVAVRDALAGLYNRFVLEAGFAPYQATAQANNQPLLLIGWDIDGLKGERSAANVLSLMLIA